MVKGQSEENLRCVPFAQPLTNRFFVIISFNCKRVNHIIKWLCLTRTGNYQIHEIWLAEIDIDRGVKCPHLDQHLVRLHFGVKMLQTKILKCLLFSSKVVSGSAKKPNEKKSRGRGNLRWFLSIALRIPTAHDFCVISARKLARARTQRKKFPSS